MRSDFEHIATFSAHNISHRLHPSPPQKNNNNIYHTLSKCPVRVVHKKDLFLFYKISLFEVISML